MHAGSWNAAFTFSIPMTTWHFVDCDCLLKEQQSAWLTIAHSVRTEYTRASVYTVEHSNGASARNSANDPLVAGPTPVHRLKRVLQSHQDLTHRRASNKARRCWHARSSARLLGLLLPLTRHPPIAEVLERCDSPVRHKDSATVFQVAPCACSVMSVSDVFARFPAADRDPVMVQL